jgi:uncharacterized protein (TIGR02145 family)
MKRILLYMLFTGILMEIAFSQVSINTDGSAPDNSAMLDVKSTNQGMLVPRMTASQIAGISNPADGLLVYNTEDGKLYIFVSSASAWKEVSYGPGTISGFTCGNSFTDARDNKIYNTVLIGTQCWMKENLNYGTMITTTAEQTDNGIPEKYCYQNFGPSCDIYGGLYQWAEMVQYLNGATNYQSWNPVPTSNVHGLCPANWHVASDAEWIVLREFLGGSGVAGGAMKETGFDHWYQPNTGATNSSNFTALPGGNRHSDGNSNNMGWLGWFWSATEAYPAVGSYWLLETVDANLDQGIFDKQDGFSVRCVHD